MTIRILSLLGLLLLLEGCFFETREPPPPELGGGCDFDFQLATTWQIALANMEGALFCGDATEYMNVIKQGDFVYEPSQSVLNNYPDVFATVWDYDREQGFVNRVFAEERYVADLGIEQGQETPNGDFSTVTTTYSIQRVDGQGNAIGAPYEDDVEFTFQRLSSLVLMVKWKDTDNLLGGIPFGNRRGDDGGGV